MANDHDDQFGVFVRANSMTTDLEGVEFPVVICSSYREARQIQRLLRRSSPECIIRFLGDAGGGD